MKKISVVIPVYNGEHFIKRCIDSILNQTYTNWELVIVDDGSTDSTVDILEEYQNKDDRINYYVQNNNGAGSARNLGMSYVSGEYLVFVDSDDWIEPQYFEKLSLCKDDVVFIDVNRISNGKKTTEFMSGFEGLDKDSLIRCQMTGCMPWGGWRKAVKLSLIKENKIRYSEHKVGEEAIYSFCVLYYSDSIRFLKDRFYNYEIREGSLSQSYNLDPWWDVCVALMKYIKKLNCYEIYANTINSFMCVGTVIALNRYAKNLSWPEYKQISKRIILRLDKATDPNYYIDKKHISKKMRMLIPMMRFPLFMFIVSRVYK